MVPREGYTRPAAADKEEIENVHVPRHIRRGTEPAASVRPLLVLAIVVAVAALPPSSTAWSNDGWYFTLTLPNAGKIDGGVGFLIEHR